MREDIFLTTSSGWFFQVDLAFPTWSWYFSLGFTFAFSYYLTSSPGSSRCRRHMGKREDPGDEVAYCLAAIIFVLLYFTFTEPIGLKDSKLCRYILEDFFSSIVTVSYSFFSHSLLYWPVAGSPSVWRAKKEGEHWNSKRAKNGGKIIHVLYTSMHITCVSSWLFGLNPKNQWLSCKRTYLRSNRTDLLNFIQRRIRIMFTCQNIGAISLTPYFRQNNFSSFRIGKIYKPRMVLNI